MTATKYTDFQIRDFNKRAALCVRTWRLMPGMLTGGHRILRVNDHGHVLACSGYEGSQAVWFATWHDPPSLNDAATLGCLHHIVTSECPDEAIYPMDIGVLVRALERIETES